MSTYKTILRPSLKILYKDKKSKFYGYAFPVRQEDEIKPILEEIKKNHPNANHVCYAWQLGIEKKRYRANDDGEPNNSAGMPIYGQIQSFELTNVLVAVARVFGGTKLGVGGLIGAYKEAAKMALQSSNIVERRLQSTFRVVFEYPETNKVMSIVKLLNLEIVSQKMEAACELHLKVDKKDEPRLKDRMAKFNNISLLKID